MELIEHGITTSDAQYWLHLFPLEAVCFAYLRQKMVQFLDEPSGDIECLLRACCREMDAKSPDGTVTGRGWLVPRDLSFVGTKKIPDQYLAGKDWRSMTGRQLGAIAGEDIALRMINDGYMFSKLTRPFKFEGKAGQLKGRDLCNGHCAIEVKTERPKTDNLFVQTHERGHKVNLRPDGTEDYVAFPKR